jgi:hypothetical protein
MYDKVFKLFEESGIDDYELVLMKASATSINKMKIARVVESGRKVIIFNVRVFALGSDLPRLDGVMLCGGRASKIDIVQSVSRCLRIVEGKGISRILIPCLVRGDDYNDDGNFESLRKFLIAMGTVDQVIFDEIRGVGGSNAVRRIGFMDLNLDVSTEVKSIIIDDSQFELRIFDRVGDSRSEDMLVLKWRQKLNEVIEFIEANGRPPSSISKNKEIRKMSAWLIRQRQIYKLSENIMKIEEVRREWENAIKTHIYLMPIDNKILWHDNLSKCLEYIKINGSPPTLTSKREEDRALSRWIGTQRKNYKQNMCIMKEDDIRAEWENVIQICPSMGNYNYIQSWHDRLDQCIKYVVDNDRIPSVSSDIESDRKLLMWINNQKSNYKKNAGLMKNNDIRVKWRATIEQYKLLNNDSNEIWLDNLNQYVEHVKNHKKLPSIKLGCEREKYLSVWMTHQKSNYKKNTGLMKNNDIRAKFETTIGEYPIIWKGFVYIENHANEPIKKSKPKKLSKTKLLSMSIEELIELAIKLGKNDTDQYEIGSRTGNGKYALIEWIYNQKLNDDVLTKDSKIQEELMPTIPIIKRKPKIVVKRS